MASRNYCDPKKILPNRIESSKVSKQNGTVTGMKQDTHDEVQHVDKPTLINRFSNPVVYLGATKKEGREDLKNDVGSRTNRFLQRLRT